MDPNDRELLDEVVALSRENNEILRAMRRRQRVGGVVRAVYWLVILGSMVGAYYYFQPQMQSVIDLYNRALQASADFGKITPAGDKMRTLFNQPAR
ncbi:MAG: hypothetical protein ACYC8S_01255 [Minisyncoccota bacterium]